MQFACLVDLPEAVQAIVFDYAGCTAWLHSACASTSVYRVLWESAFFWSHVLMNVGEDPGRPDLDATSKRHCFRRHLFGIDLFTWRRARRVLCLDSLPTGTGIGCHAALLREAVRACQGLHVADGAAIADAIASCCVELLGSFDIDDLVAQAEAETLSVVALSRTDVFSAEQRSDAAAAFTEAMDFRLLMRDAMQPLELHEEDEGLLRQFDSEMPPATEGQCSPETLDRLMTTLREACS